jgi:hypothetical protein
VNAVNYVSHPSTRATRSLRWHPLPYSWVAILLGGGPHAARLGTGPCVFVFPPPFVSLHNTDRRYGNGMLTHRLR